MVISLLGKRKVRILQAHNNCGGIVIRKSGFIKFNSPEEATDNMDLLMRFMASNRVGDTADPKNFFGVSQYVPSNHPTNGREGVDRKNSPRPADHSGAQRRWVIARGASRGDPRDHVTSQFDTSQARQRSGEELSEVDS
jgi:hypothetical protein